MFDFHMHSRVSFDSDEESAKMLRIAEQKGLSEICFTDHYDFNDVDRNDRDIFKIEDYKQEYDGLTSKKVKIRHGVEFGLTHWNKIELENLVKSYNFDFVIGSVHTVSGYDPYFKEYWTYHGNENAFKNYLIQTLDCVKYHNGFDVLGHINYPSKSIHNPTNTPFRYSEYPDICDEIMKTIAGKGIGIEINTSGFDRIGEFLPSYDYVRRFKELGGEIITVGSDAHTCDRVGQYVNKALEIAKDVFGYVCTFEKRKPIFNKL